MQVTSLEFMRDRKRLAVRRSESTIALVDLRGGPTLELPLPHVHAFAAVGDHVWILAGMPPALHAYDARGTLLARLELPALADAPPTKLRRAGAGPLAGCGSLAIAFANQQLVATPVDLDLVLPLSSTRMLVGDRTRLALRDQGVTRWTQPGIGELEEAALVLDGRAIALTTTTATGRAIAVLGIRDGATLHRIAVDDAVEVRIAATRGIALARTAGDRLVAIDLRFGRVLVEYEELQALDEVAIDDTGQDIAIRLRDPADELRLVTLADLQQAAADASRSRRDEPAPAATAAPDPVVAPEAASPDAAPADLFGAATPLVLTTPALVPRVTTVLDPITARAAHAHERERVVAILGLAISNAWDEGRLAHANTSGLPFHSEVFAVTASQCGLALEEVDAAQRRYAELAPSIPGHLDALAKDLGLSEVARDVLQLVAAPSLWGELARLYGILANDEGRPLVDELLVGELLASCGIDRGAIARELDDDAPLIKHGAVRVLSGPMRPFLPLVVDPVVLRLLEGTSVEASLAPLVVPRAADRTVAELRIPSRVKHEIVERLALASGTLRVVVRGRTGSGRHTLLAAIARDANRVLGVLDASSLVRDPRRIGELAVALERAHLAGMVPCIDGLELIGSGDVATRDRVREILRGHAGPLAVRLPVETTPPLDPGYVQIDLPFLTLTERHACWTATLASHGLRVAELGELADRFSVGPGVIERVATAVARTITDPASDAGVRLELGIRQHLESRLGGSANRVHRLASWGQIVLPADIQDSLTELIARIKHRRTVFDTWGFDRVMSTSRGVTALFQGGPGTGKTLVASAIANELGMDLYRVDLSRVMSKWIGETEQNLAMLFDAAEDGNTIILFDEADSLFAKRTEVKSSVDRYANLEVNYLLQRIDTFEGIAILTTNFGTSIDNAFKRRLSIRLTFPFPDEDMREKLWESHLPPELPRAGTFDLADIARRYRMSGGYIRNVTLRAAFLAAEEHSALTQEHLERAIKAEFREIGKIAESGVLE